MSERTFLGVSALVTLVLFAVLVICLLSGCHDCDHHNKTTINPPQPVTPLPELVIDCELIERDLIEISVHNSVTAILRANNGDTALAMKAGDYNIYYAICGEGTFTFVLDSLPSGEYTPVQCEVIVGQTLVNGVAALGCVVQEQDQEKVEMCHNGRTIKVSPHAVQAHLNHGDTEGACIEPPPVDPPVPPVPCVEGFVAEIVE